MFILKDKNPPRVLVISTDTAAQNEYKILQNPKKSLKLNQMIFSIFKTFSSDTNNLNYDLDFTTNIEDALRVIAREGSYAVAFIDIPLNFSKWDPIETIQKIWKTDPKIHIVLCTEESDRYWKETQKNLVKTHRLLLLQKPFKPAQIKQLAILLIEKWQAENQLNQENKSAEQIFKDKLDELEKIIFLMRSTLETTADGILVINTEGKIAGYNQKFVDMWRIPQLVVDLEGDDSVLKYILEQTKKQNLLAKIKTPEKLPTVEDFEEIELKDGRFIECYSLPHQIHNEIIGRTWSFRDVTERKRLQEELLHQATYDLLTDLPNRSLLFDRIHQAINLSRRTSEPVPLLFIDLDRFKLVNDSLGHAIGDGLLKQVGKRLVESVRTSDTVARLGGDEFVVVLGSVKNEFEIRQIAQKLLTVLTLPFQIYDHELRITASMGISVYPQDGEDPNTLLKNADTSMYFAKNQGRNNFKFYNINMNVDLLDRLVLENDLRQALNRNELILHYQPLADMKTGKVIGVEALARWAHPKLGLLPPMDFIPLSEETGLIISIGEWVLRTACAQVHAWKKEGLQPIHLAVNVSVHQLKQPDFDKLIKKVLDETNIDPHSLELEITEGSIMENPEHIIKTLKRIKVFGIQLVIDDFGTGYSNLSYLKKFPFDKLKIDKSFISEVQLENNDSAIIRAIIAMASSLNLRVIAEGMETNAQLQFLKRNHCDEIQGFFFSKPVPPEVLEQLLRSQSKLP